MDSLLDTVSIFSIRTFLTTCVKRILVVGDCVLIHSVHKSREDVHQSMVDDGVRSFSSPDSPPVELR